MPRLISNRGENNLLPISSQKAISQRGAAAMANLSLNQIVITGTNPAVIHTLKKKTPRLSLF